MLRNTARRRRRPIRVFIRFITDDLPALRCGSQALSPGAHLNIPYLKPHPRRPNYNRPLTRLDAQSAAGQVEMVAAVEDAPQCFAIGTDPLGRKRMHVGRAVFLRRRVGPLGEVSAISHRPPRSPKMLAFIKSPIALFRVNAHAQQETPSRRMIDTGGAPTNPSRVGEDGFQIVEFPRPLR